MNGWLVLAILFAAALGALYAMGLRGAFLQLAAAVLLLGSAGYALQGRPDLPGSPRASVRSEPPIPLTRFRHAFFGQFTSAEPWLRISEALASRGKTEDAVGVLRSAVRERPQNPILWVGLGNALVDHSHGLTPASQYAFERSAELAPGHPAPAFFYGLALARSGESEAAAALWRELLAGAPADAPWRGMIEDALAVIEGPERTAR